MTGEPLEEILDDETCEAWRVLKNSVRSEGSVVDIVVKAVERLAREKYALLRATAHLPFHPQDYDGECLCSVCQVAASYEVGDDQDMPHGEPPHLPHETGGGEGA